MNPLSIKALLITGGTVGVGVPGMYYAYPHISKLISSPEKVDQKSTKNSQAISLKGDGDGTSREGTSGNNSSPIKSNSANPTNNAGDSSSSTDAKKVESKGATPNQENTNSDNGQGSNPSSGNSTTPSTGQGGGLQAGS